VGEGAPQVRHGDALVDAQPLDLAEHGRVRRVEGVVAEHPAGRDDVAGQAALEQ
jgi:hypothetical protein